jgi:hypothetical protein
MYVYQRYVNDVSLCISFLGFFSKWVCCYIVIRRVLGKWGLLRCCLYFSKLSPSGLLPGYFGGDCLVALDCGFVGRGLSSSLYQFLEFKSFSYILIFFLI